MTTEHIIIHVIDDQRTITTMNVIGDDGATFQRERRDGRVVNTITADTDGPVTTSTARTPLEAASQLIAAAYEERDKDRAELQRVRRLLTTTYEELSLISQRAGGIHDTTDPDEEDA